MWIWFQSPRTGKFESNYWCNRRKSCRAVTWFQSPRTGKFESNNVRKQLSWILRFSFQSPRTGKFESNQIQMFQVLSVLPMFQSPRTGKFESNKNKGENMNKVQISFNPLERGNSNQIQKQRPSVSSGKPFQSPRTGKFESNPAAVRTSIHNRVTVSIPQNGEIRIKFRSWLRSSRQSTRVSIPQNGEIRIKS